MPVTDSSPPTLAAGDYVMEFLNSKGKADKPEYSFMDGEMEFTISFSGVQTGTPGSAWVTVMCKVP